MQEDGVIAMDQGGLIIKPVNATLGNAQWLQMRAALLDPTGLKTASAVPSQGYFESWKGHRYHGWSVRGREVKPDVYFRDDFNYHSENFFTGSTRIPAWKQEQVSGNGTINGNSETTLTQPWGGHVIVDSGTTASGETRMIGPASVRFRRAGTGPDRVVYFFARAGILFAKTDGISRIGIVHDVGGTKEFLGFASNDATANTWEFQHATGGTVHQRLALQTVSAPAALEDALKDFYMVLVPTGGGTATFNVWMDGESAMSGDTGLTTTPASDNYAPYIESRETTAGDQAIVVDLMEVWSEVLKDT